MTDIIDLSEQRNRRVKPDDDHVRQDEYGRPLYRFLLEYEHEGSTWSLHLWAYDAADAAAKVVSIGRGVRLLGQIFTGVPA